MHPRLAEVARQPGEGALIILLPGENLGDPDAADAFLQVGVHVGAFVGNRLPGPALAVFDQDHNRQEYGKPCQNQERKLHIDHEHKNGDKQQVHNFQHKVDDPVGQHIRYGVDVVDHADQDFALGPVIIILERQLLQMLEQIRTDIEDNILPHPGHNSGAVCRHNDAGYNGEEDQGRPADQGSDCFIRNNHIHDMLHDQRGGEADGRRQRT
ncbi:hypothetical protein D3C81_1545980 [compost metagenome]